MKKLMIVGAMMALLAFGSGCALLVVGGVAAAGAGGYAYVKGEVKSTQPVPMDQAWKATLAAVKELQFPVISQAKDALSAEVTVRNASDTKIVIKVTKLYENSTEISIRVGTFGDESLSRQILQQIQKHL